MKCYYHKTQCWHCPHVGMEWTCPLFMPWRPGAPEPVKRPYNLAVRICLIVAAVSLALAAIIAIGGVL